MVIATNMKSEKNTIWIGINASKKELEIHTYEKALKLPSVLPNTKNGINKIITKVKKFNSVQIVFKATGSYEKFYSLYFKLKKLKYPKLLLH